MFSGPPTHRYEPVPLGRVVRITSIFAAGVVLPMWAISVSTYAEPFNSRWR